MRSVSEPPAICARRRLRRRGSIGISVTDPDRSRSNVANLAAALALTAPWGQRAAAAARARSSADIRAAQSCSCPHLQRTVFMFRDRNPHMLRVTSIPMRIRI
jgi:hypothetical protein